MKVSTMSMLPYDSKVCRMMLNSRMVQCTFMYFMDFNAITPARSNIIKSNDPLTVGGKTLGGKMLPTRVLFKGRGGGGGGGGGVQP